MIAAVFRAIAVAEMQHEKRFLAFLENIEKDRVFKREGVVRWRCSNCGYIHEGTEALAVFEVKVCAEAYFELLGENW